MHCVCTQLAPMIQWIYSNFHSLYLQNDCQLTGPWSVYDMISSTHLLDVVPPRVKGFTAYSPTPSSIVLSWKQNTTTIEYYRVSSANALQVLIHWVNSSMSVFYIYCISQDIWQCNIAIFLAINFALYCNIVTYTTATCSASTVCNLLIIVKPHCCLSLYVAYMCLQLTLHNAEANTSTTENYDLFRTVTSHTFHNLSHSTAYSLTIMAINKAGSGPPVSVNVTTQGAPSGNRACV